MSEHNPDDPRTLSRGDTVRMDVHDRAETDHPVTYRELQRLLLTVFGLGLLVYLAVPLANLFLFFLLVFILAAVLNPVVVWLADRGIPRTLAAVGVVMLVVGLLVLIGWFAFPRLLDQVTTTFEQFDLGKLQVAEYYEGLLDRYPELARQLPPPIEVFREMSPGLGSIVGQAGRYLFGAVSGLFSIVLLLILVIYAVAEPKPLIAGLLGIVPRARRERAETALLRSMEQLRNWMVASLIVGAIVGTVTGVGLHFLGVPNEFLFAVLAGFGEFIPVIGPIIVAVPAVLYALTVDVRLALYVSVFYIALQQLEGNVLSPKILSHSMKLHPVSLLFVLLAMHSLFGLLGAILAAPVTAIIKVCWQEFYSKPQDIDRHEIQREASAIIHEEGKPDNPAGPVGTEEPEA